MPLNRRESSPPLSSSPRSSSSSSQSEPADVVRLKRALEERQKKIEELESGQTKPKRKWTPRTGGRGIRHIISMYDPVSFIMDRATDALVEEEDENAEEVELTKTEEELAIMKANRDRISTAYTLLMEHIPALNKMVSNPQVSQKEINSFVNDLDNGAKDARSDDLQRIRALVAEWINADYSPERPLRSGDRDGRGFKNITTGGLLCGITYDWSNPKIRQDIIDMKLNVGDDYFLTCLYPKGEGSADDVEHKFLKSQLLVKTFCAIFTSPSSADAFEEETEEGAKRKIQKTSRQKKATRKSVSGKLNMTEVTPRSIAYTAVMLAFNLTSAISWMEEVDGFNFRLFWEFIVDYFERPDGPEAAKRVATLLRWWNKQVFPNQVAAASASNSSRKKLAAQRKAKEQEAAANRSQTSS